MVITGWGSIVTDKAGTNIETGRKENSNHCLSTTTENSLACGGKRERGTEREMYMYIK
jgi:hypothetical protein